ncbi:hypothetical protein NDU88_002570 [Pleurodeles waltl]|uniref:Uncharacterized protein n=1 Tax=Pleurodeles waltl TaxID=8319 RepID=A0AAV7SCW5_PLEWA|nr:hypothetical protein NDU88_002570 [Pleurodeles waltl]
MDVIGGTVRSKGPKETMEHAARRCHTIAAHSYGSSAADTERLTSVKVIEGHRPDATEYTRPSVELDVPRCDHYKDARRGVDLDHI